jgi:hypothetical protein
MNGRAESTGLAVASGLLDVQKTPASTQVRFVGTILLASLHIVGGCDRGLSEAQKVAEEKQPPSTVSPKNLTEEVLFDNAVDLYASQPSLGHWNEYERELIRRGTSCVPRALAKMTSEYDNDRWVAWHVLQGVLHAEFESCLTDEEKPNADDLWRALCVRNGDYSPFEDESTSKQRTLSQEMWMQYFKTIQEEKSRLGKAK